MTGRFWTETSWTIWSNALFKNVDYMATIGRIPCVAKPAENVTA